MASHNKRPIVVNNHTNMPPHPRRPAAHNSMSLLHSKRQIHAARFSNAKTSESDSSGKSQQRQSGSNSTDSPSSLIPAKESSGESSNAERWFEKSNNQVHDHSASFNDDEPPFFMRNSSSADTPPDGLVQRLALQQQSVEGSGSLPLRTDMLRIGTDGSSIEEYRGVIDDLTIENKKLKRRLKKFQKLHDSRAKHEKLFEVNVPGLSSAQKRELEETLQNFAARVDNNTGFHPDGYAALLPALTKGATSATSIQNTDSAYHTNSASGPDSSGWSGNDRMPTYHKQSAATRRQNIHSYLHHIPEGLHPRPNHNNLSDRTKKKLAVRRLEQIFTGRLAHGKHSLPLQQQEVSWTADGADQRLQQEGRREAYIMALRRENSTGVPTQGGPQTHQNGVDAGVNTALSAQEDRARELQIEQRPTRPLDVDPHRAQVAAENMEYIRHLGFSPPNPSSRTPLDDKHGWIYLNLLCNMAQLHDLNVTAEFIRKALSEESNNKFELSNDGRKVRWIGERSALGNPMAHSGRSGGDSSSSRADVGTPDGESPAVRPKLVSNQSGWSVRSTKSQETSKFQYTPIFFHRNNSEDTDDDDSSDEENSTFSLQQPQVNGDSSAMTSSGMHTVSTKRRKIRDDGPLIFYKNANFMADLSGEHVIDNGGYGTRYNAIGVKPLGLPQDVLSPMTEGRGPLAMAAELPEPMNLTDNPIPASMELSFPTQHSHSTHDIEMAAPIDLEVTGIGGVWPADNFTIGVKSRHVSAECEQVSKRPISRIIAPQVAKVLDADNSRHTASQKSRRLEVISAKRQDLPPSELPPALNYMSPEYDSDDESVMDGDEDEMQWDSHLSDGHAPSAAPQPVELHYVSSDEDDASSAESDDGRPAIEETFDMLATARELDPQAIWNSEREFDANMAERLAEEIPAGSSAATAGGGSGYASPAGSNVDADEHKRSTRRARRQAATLRRATRSSRESVPSDSMIVQRADQSDDDEMEDNADQRS